MIIIVIKANVKPPQKKKDNSQGAQQDKIKKPRTL